jgi:hypothetical protein
MLKPSIILVFAFLCFSSPNTTLAENVTCRWAKFANSGGSYAFANAVDANGNVYVAGSFYGTVDFGGTNLTYVGGLQGDKGGDSFFAKYNKDGNLLWIRQGLCTSADWADGIAVDHLGNVYVSGGFTGDLTFGVVTLTGATNVFNNPIPEVYVVKYNSIGEMVWAHQSFSAGTSSSSRYTDVEVDGLGNVYLAANVQFSGGFTPTNPTFGTNVVPGVAQEPPRGVLVKYNSSGVAEWVRRGEEFAYDLAVSPNGDVFTAGWSSGSETRTGLHRYDPQGVEQWGRYVTGDGFYSLHISIDYQTNIYMLGHFLGSTSTFGSVTLTNRGGAADSFLAKYDAAGTFSWVQQIGGSQYDGFEALATDDAGDVYALGIFDSSAGYTASIGGLSYTTSYPREVVTAKFNGEGEPLWVKQIGYGMAPQREGGLSVDSSGRINIAGFGAVICNGTVLNSNANVSVSGYFFMLQLEKQLDPPLILNEPSSTTLILGESGALFVTATGTPPLLYQWQHEGTNIPGASNSTFNIYNAGANNAGNYRVVVFNEGGSLTSHVAVVTLLLPPQITSQPVSQIVSPGATANLSVGVIGTEPFGYQWQLNGLELAGATNATLVLSNISSTAMGNYSVTVSNVAGVIKSSNTVVSTIDIKMFAGVIIQSVAGTEFRIEFLDILDPSSGWQMLTNIMIQASPHVFIDYESPNHASRFYRAVPLR